MAWQYIPTTRLRPRRSPSRFCWLQQEIQSPPHVIGVAPIAMRVARPEVGEQGQSGERGIRFPVRALAKTGLSRRTVRGIVVVALHGRAVRVPGDPGVPPAVLILVASQPVDRALDRELAGGTRPDPLSLRGSVGVKPRKVDFRDLRPEPAGLSDRRAPPARCRRFRLRWPSAWPEPVGIGSRAAELPGGPGDEIEVASSAFSAEPFSAG